MKTAVCDHKGCYGCKLIICLGTDVRYPGNMVSIKFTAVIIMFTILSKHNNNKEKVVV